VNPLSIMPSHDGPLDAFSTTATLRLPSVAMYCRLHRHHQDLIICEFIYCFSSSKIIKPSQATCPQPHQAYLITTPISTPRSPLPMPYLPAQSKSTTPPPSSPSALSKPRHRPPSPPSSPMPMSSSVPGLGGTRMHRRDSACLARQPSCCGSDCRNWWNSRLRKQGDR
jgi:hypothetical protein